MIWLLAGAFLVVAFLLAMGRTSAAASSDRPSARRPRSPPADWPINSEGLPVITGQGAYSYDVVGESHYQQHLDRIAGGKKEHTHFLPVAAVLVMEDDNPTDPKAVRVDIDGEPVGYLSRDDARNFRQRLKRRHLAARVVACDAVITGGYRNGTRESHFGVRLDL